MSVWHCQQAVSSAEFVEWRAWLRLHPDQADVKADWRHAALMALLANAHRDAKKRPRPFAVEDFLPQWDGPAPEPAPEEMLAKVYALNAQFGGRVVN